MRWTTATGALGVILALTLVGLPAARRLGPPEPVLPGKPVAPFSLQDASGRSLDLSELAPPGSSALVLVYWSPRCPISRGYEARLGDLAVATAERGVRWYAVVADAEVSEAELNATTGPGGLTLPLLRDRRATAARRLGVTSTPQAIVIDREGKLAYSGAIDSNLFGDGSSRTPYLAAAVEAVLVGKTPAPALTRSFGTSVEGPGSGLARLGPGL